MSAGIEPAQVFSFTLTVFCDPAEPPERRWGAHVYLSAADRPTPQGGRRLFVGYGICPREAATAAVEAAFRNYEVYVG